MMCEMKIVLLKLNAFQFPHAKLRVNSLRLGVLFVNVESDTFGYRVCVGSSHNKIIKCTEYTFATIFRQDIG